MTEIRDWLRVHWWVLVLLTVTLAGTLGRWHDHDGAAPAVFGGLAVLPLFARRRRPELTWLGNAAVVTCYFALGYGDGPVYLGTLASAYALTSRWPPRRWSPYAFAAAPVAVAMASRWSDWTSASVVARTTWFVAVLSAAAAIGAAMRTRGETRREHARRTATEERLRMAQDLHDGVGHGLAVIAMQAGVALHVLDRDPAKARDSLLAIRETSRESLEALREELTRLAADDRRGPRTPRNALEDLPALIDRVRAGGLEVRLDRRYDAVPDDVGEAVYLVVQEALTNVLRHSGAGSAVVEVAAAGGEVLVSVVDDGHGGPVDEGLGIRGMRARVEQVGGTLRIGPTAHGFEVQARIPVPAR